MSANCPFCKRDIEDSIDDSEFDFNYDGDSIDMNCPHCKRPLDVTAWVRVDYFVKPNKTAELAEANKYKKRMAGDWS